MFPGNYVNMFDLVVKVILSVLLFGVPIAFIQFNKKVWWLANSLSDIIIFSETEEIKRLRAADKEKEEEVRRMVRS